MFKMSVLGAHSKVLTRRKPSNLEFGFYTKVCVTFSFLDDIIRHMLALFRLLDDVWGRKISEFNDKLLANTIHLSCTRHNLKWRIYLIYENKSLSMAATKETLNYYWAETPAKIKLYCWTWTFLATGNEELQLSEMQSDSHTEERAARCLEKAALSSVRPFQLPSLCSPLV